MNREIKFRVFYRPERKMRYFDLSDIGMLYQYGDPEEMDVMQYTGLTDKNGKEIYEGDILQVFKPNSYLRGVYVVKWNDIGMWAYTSKTGKWAIKGNDQPYLVGQKNCEVIGHLYENPELLTS